MAKEFERSDRVADAVQKTLAHLIAREIRDPRIGMVNINEVSVAKDLAIAKVYLTFVGQNDPQKGEESVAVLNHAANYLRTLLSKELTMRAVPSLQFFYDQTALEGQALSHLIDQAIASDKAKHVDE